jgi:hypothetical protein
MEDYCKDKTEEVLRLKSSACVSWLSEERAQDNTLFLG